MLKSRLKARPAHPVTETLEVATTQRVQVDLLDVPGRKLATPFRDRVTAYTPTAFTIEKEGLIPGTYILKITGETFSELRCLDITR